MKIGVQLYTIRDHLKTAQEVDSSLKRIKDMGFDMVQISGVGQCSTDELSDLLKKHEIEACGTHSPWEQMEERASLAKLIEDHKKLGCSQVGIGIIPNKYPHTYDGYTDFIKKLNEVIAQVKDAGLGFGYHNHENEFQKFNGVCAIDRMIEECPDLEFTLDVFWVQAGGADPCDYIDKLKDRIRILHLKDYRVVGRKREFAEIGEGNLNWKDIFSLGWRHKIPYAVIEQDANFLTGPFESLELSKKYIVENGRWK